MKILSKVAISTSILCSLTFAQTTMCFKENHTNLTTLETVKLDGGECQSKMSLSDMKANGWSVDDIKINNNNYIYILKKETHTQSMPSNMDMQAFEAKLLAKMEKKKEIEEAKKVEIEKATNAQNGKELYTSKCQSCHGEKGQKEPGFSDKIASLEKEDFKYRISSYRNGTYNKGSAVQMVSYAMTMSTTDINNVFDYLESINK